jgi:hypothetical protein
MVYTRHDADDGVSPISDVTAPGDSADPARFGYKQSLVEPALFRDTGFKEICAHVVVMVAIGAAYLGCLLVSGGRHGLSMPDMHSIHAEIGSKAAGN